MISRGLEVRHQPRGIHRFNLVIEVLLISSAAGLDADQTESALFQSRNRGSFDFKNKTAFPQCDICTGFNLVIEVLLISSSSVPSSGLILSKFQSRNRGSFDFKFTKNNHRIILLCCFNLVIEVLLISSLAKIIQKRLT